MNTICVLVKKQRSWRIEALVEAIMLMMHRWTFFAASDKTKIGRREQTKYVCNKTCNHFSFNDVIHRQYADQSGNFGDEICICMPRFFMSLLIFFAVHHERFMIEREQGNWVFELAYRCLAIGLENRTHSMWLWKCSLMLFSVCSLIWIRRPIRIRAVINIRKNSHSQW